MKATIIWFCAALVKIKYLQNKSPLTGHTTMATFNVNTPTQMRKLPTTNHHAALYRESGCISLFNPDESHKSQS